MFAGAARSIRSCRIPSLARTLTACAGIVGLCAVCIAPGIADPPPATKPTSLHQVLDDPEGERFFRELTEAEVRLGLVMAMPDYTFDGTPFVEVVDMFRDLTPLPIFVNWKAIENAGVSRDLPVTFTIANRPTVAQALDQILAQIGGNRVALVWQVDEAVVCITTREDANAAVLTRVYDIRDLIQRELAEDGVSRNAAVAKIMRSVQGLDPLNYKDFGGKVGAIREVSGKLVITQTITGHSEIAALLQSKRALKPEARPAVPPVDDK